jgi:hypothetical protein
MIADRRLEDISMVSEEASDLPLTYQPDSMLGAYQIIRTDAFAWLESARPSSIHAVVTDPPYGLLEYTPRELEKMRSGKGGMWRFPPAFDRGTTPTPSPLHCSDAGRSHEFACLF